MAARVLVPEAPASRLSSFPQTPLPELHASPAYPVVFNLHSQDGRRLDGRWGQADDDLDPPNRSLNESCGYPTCVTPARCQALARRFGLAARVNSVYADEVWAGTPSVYERSSAGQESPFEVGIRDLVERLSLWSHLHRLDVLAGFGEFGLLFWGFDDGLDPATPVANLSSRPRGPGRPPAAPDPDNPLGVSYVRTFLSTDVQVKEWVTDRRSPRFGQPESYQLRFARPQTPVATLPAPVAVADEWVQVHWSRCLHYADGPPGTPAHPLRLEAPFNHLLDVRKTLGGSAEMFWKGGFPGLALVTHPQNTAPRLDRASVEREMANYFDRLQNWLALTNLDVKTLNPTIADPGPHVREQLQAIAAGRAVPVPVLLGVDVGVAAGTQTNKAWKGRVSGWRERVTTPSLVRAAVDRLVAVNAAPKPATARYQVDWPDLSTDTDADKAQSAVRLSQAVLQYVSGGGELVMPVDHFLTIVLGLPDAAAKEVLKAARAQGESALLTKEMWAPKAAQQTSPTGQAASATGATGSSNGVARR